MLDAIPLEYVVGLAAVLAVVAIAAWRRGSLSITTDVDNDGTDETFEADFSGGDETDAEGVPTGYSTIEAEDNEPSEAEAEDSEPSPSGAYTSLTDITGIGPTTAEALRDAGIASPTQVYVAADNELLAVDGIGPATLDTIRDDIGAAEREAKPEGYPTDPPSKQ